jgi:hypothetical protein
MSRARSPNDGGCRPRPRRTHRPVHPSESRKFRTLIEIADVVAVATPTAPSGSSPTQNASAGPLPRTGSPHGGSMSWRDGVDDGRDAHPATPAAAAGRGCRDRARGQLIQQTSSFWLRPMAREPRVAAAPASVGPASEGGKRSRCDVNHDAIYLLAHRLGERVVVPPRHRAGPGRRRPGSPARRGPCPGPHGHLPGPLHPPGHLLAGTGRRCWRCLSSPGGAGF